VRDNLEAWADEQAARQERLLAELQEPPAELLEGLAEQSARAAELLLAEQEARQDVLEELARRQAEALAELILREM
jgi:hypothetical protein